MVLQIKAIMFTMLGTLKGFWYFRIWFYVLLWFIYLATSYPFILWIRMCDQCRPMSTCMSLFDLDVHWMFEDSFQNFLLRSKQCRSWWDFTYMQDDLDLHWMHMGHKLYPWSGGNSYMHILPCFASIQFNIKVNFHIDHFFCCSHILSFLHKNTSWKEC